jgi:hypothetical protein
VGKPSIFSSDYRRKMRARRNRRLFVIFVLIFGGVAFLSGGPIKDWFSSGANTIGTGFTDVRGFFSNRDRKPVDKPDSEPDGSPSYDENDAEDKATENKAVEKSYVVTLNDGTIINAIYEEKDGKRVFKRLSTELFYYSISSSGKNIVILDDKTQDILVIDIDGKVTDVTMKQYVATDGKVYPKENQLQRRPEYVWSASPKFLSDDKIVYISQLPFLSKQDRYLWVINLPNREGAAPVHKRVANVKALSITLGSIEDEGMKITIDEKERYLDLSGRLK